MNFDFLLGKDKETEDNAEENSKQVKQVPYIKYVVSGKTYAYYHDDYDKDLEFFKNRLDDLRDEKVVELEGEDGFVRGSEVETAWIEFKEVLRE